MKTKAHADEIVGCLGWSLLPEDVAILEEAHDVSEQHAIHPAYRLCIVLHAF